MAHVVQGLDDSDAKDSQNQIEEDGLEATAFPENHPCHGLRLTRKHHDLMRYLELGHSVFLNGAAGTGKSGGLRYALTSPWATDVRRRPTITLTAGTGLAAQVATIPGLVGKTLHEWAGIQTATLSLDALWGQLMRKSRVFNRLRTDYCTTQILVIDEVGTIEPHAFTLVDGLAKRFRQVYDKPFGGMQLLLTGDFHQLGAVDVKNRVSNAVKRIHYERRQIRDWFAAYNVSGIRGEIVDIITDYHTFEFSKADQESIYLFKCPVWKQLNCVNIEFDVNFRQKEDPEWFGILTRMRYNNLTVADHNKLRSRDISICQDPLTHKWFRDPEFHPMDRYHDGNDFAIPLLHSYKKAVREYNDEQLRRDRKANEEVWTYTSELRFHNAEEPGSGILTLNKDASNFKDFPKFVQKAVLNFQEPLQLLLLVGVTVIVVRNLSTNRLKNGTRAKVVELDERHRYVDILTEDGRRERIQKIVSLIRDPREGVQLGDANSYASFQQFPLTLAYALTLHKSQGQTMTSAVIDLTATNQTPNQSYMGCSRVKKLKDLHLIGYHRDAFVSDPYVLQYSEQVRIEREQKQT